jgi:hypothetical protein|tara:strand:+ start:188 stop:337 length:150 start_codon:yes stop_codon:yes gene_type:complete
MAIGLIAVICGHPITGWFLLDELLSLASKCYRHDNSAMLDIEETGEANE